MVNGCYAFFHRRRCGIYYICLWFAGWRHHEKKLSAAVKWCHRCYQRDVQGGWWVLPRTRPELWFLRVQGVELALSFRSLLWALRICFLKFQVISENSGLDYWCSRQVHQSHTIWWHWKMALISRAPGQIIQIIQRSVVKMWPARRKSESPKTRVPKIKSELPVTQKPPQWQDTAVCSVWCFTLSHSGKTHSQRWFLDLVSTLQLPLYLQLQFHLSFPYASVSIYSYGWLAQWWLHGIWHVCI